MKAYHFTANALRDGSPIPPVGEWLTYEGNVRICCSGLHASYDPFDALHYAPGATLHQVEVEQIVEEQGDKLVCRRRKIVKTVDATALIRKFACECALSVIHLWNAPDVVKRYLETQNESLRQEAYNAAYVACKVAHATSYVASYAAHAASYAASNAAHATSYAASNAARVASKAAWEASYVAYAASDVASNAAYVAYVASYAVREQQRIRFNQLVAEAFGE
jgi:hypothetical protein